MHYFLNIIISKVLDNLGVPFVFGMCSIRSTADMKADSNLIGLQMNFALILRFELYEIVPSLSKGFLSIIILDSS